MSSTALILLAAVFGTISVLISCTFLHPTVENSAVGVIRSKTHKAASTYVQYQPGANRGFRTPTEIPIAEAFVFTIDMEGQTEPINYSLNTTASEQFSVGDRVRVTYTKKSLGSFWNRIYILDIFPDK